MISNDGICRSYLMHSYLYYVLSQPLISDHEFDKLCKDMNRMWNDLTGPYKEFILKHETAPDEWGEPKGLELFEEDYPSEVKEAAKELIR